MQSGQPGEEDAVRTRSSLRRAGQRPAAGQPRSNAIRRCRIRARVFQILKKHFARYTPEMVEQVTGCPKETFLKVAETLLAQLRAGQDLGHLLRGRLDTAHLRRADDRHRGTLQLLLGNIGRPGGGMMALRGHATIQGSTDVPTLYHSIHGYMTAPTVLKTHNTVEEFLKTETLPTGYWANTPKFFVSYLKSMYGDAATADNDFGFAWHPRIIGDHSHMPMMIAMAEGG